MKDLSYLTLMDIYGAALTAKQRDMMADYYERDYSLSEIADNYGVSRQAVHFAVKQAEESLKHFESLFGVCAFVGILNEKLSVVKRGLQNKDAAMARIAELEEFIRSKYGSVWQS